MSNIETFTPEEFYEKEQTSTKPIVLTFVQDKCATCDRMLKCLESLTEKNESDLPVFKVNVEKREGQEMARKIGVIDEPTLVAFHEQYPIRAHRGFMDESHLRQWLKRLQPDH